VGITYNPYGINPRSDQPLSSLGDLLVNSSYIGGAGPQPQMEQRPIPRGSQPFDAASLFAPVDQQQPFNPYSSIPPASDLPDQFKTIPQLEEESEQRLRREEEDKLKMLLEAADIEDQYKRKEAEEAAIRDASRRAQLEEEARLRRVKMNELAPGTAGMSIPQLEDVAGYKGIAGEIAYSSPEEALMTPQEANLMGQMAPEVDFYEGLKRKYSKENAEALRRIPFFGPAAGYIYDKEVESAKERLANKDIAYGPNPENDPQYRIDTRVVTKHENDANYWAGREYTDGIGGTGVFGGRSGEMLGEAIPYMAEFGAARSLLSGMGKGGAALTSRAGSIPTRIARRAGESLAISGITATRALEQSSRYGAEYSVLPDELGDLEVKMTEAGDTEGLKLLKGFASNLTDVVFESAGEAAGVASKALMKAIPDGAARKYLEDVAKRYGASKFGKFVETLNKYGVQGPFAEYYLEEYPVAIANVLMGLDVEAQRAGESFKDRLYDAATPSWKEEQAPALSAFAVPIVGAGMLSTGLQAKEDSRRRKIMEDANKLTTEYGIHPRRAAEISSVFESGERDRATKMLQEERVKLARRQQVGSVLADKEKEINSSDVREVYKSLREEGISHIEAMSEIQIQLRARYKGERQAFAAVSALEGDSNKSEEDISRPGPGGRGDVTVERIREEYGITDTATLEIIRRLGNAAQTDSEVESYESQVNEYLNRTGLTPLETPDMGQAAQPEDQDAVQVGEAAQVPVGEGAGAGPQVGQEVRVEAQPAQEQGEKAQAVNIEDIKIERGGKRRLGTQGVSYDTAERLIKNIGLNPNDYSSLKEVAEVIRNNPELLDNLRKEVANNPITLSVLPDGSVDIIDGNHRAVLMDMVGETQIPFKLSKNSQSLEFAGITPASALPPSQGEIIDEVVEPTTGAMGQQPGGDQGVGVQDGGAGQQRVVQPGVPSAQIQPEVAAATATPEIQQQPSVTPEQSRIRVIRGDQIRTVEDADAIVRRAGSEQKKHFDEVLQSSGQEAAMDYAATINAKEFEAYGKRFKKVGGRWFRAQENGRMTPVNYGWTSTGYDRPKTAEDAAMARFLDPIGHRRAVDRSVDHVNALYANSGMRVQLVETPEQLPDADREPVLQKMRQEGAIPDGIYRGQDSIYVIRSFVQPDRAVAVASHELVGHGGLDAFFDGDQEAKNKFLLGVWSTMSPKMRTTALGIIGRKKPIGNDAESRNAVLESVEEMFAQVQEYRDIDPGIYRRVVSGIKTVVRDFVRSVNKRYNLNIPVPSYTEADVDAFATNLRNNLRRGRIGRTAPQEAQPEAEQAAAVPQAEAMAPADSAVDMRLPDTPSIESARKTYFARRKQAVAKKQIPGGVIPYEYEIGVVTRDGAVYSKNTANQSPTDHFKTFGGLAVGSAHYHKMGDNIVWTTDHIPDDEDALNSYYSRKWSNDLSHSKIYGGRRFDRKRGTTFSRSGTGQQIDLAMQAPSMQPLREVQTDEATTQIPQQEAAAPVAVEAVDERRGGGDLRERAEGPSITPLEGAPLGQTVEGPDPEVNRAAEEYARRNGIDLRRQSEFVKVDKDRARRIAQAYDEMVHQPNDPAVKEAYDELIRQTREQYDVLEEMGYEFTFFDSETDPYSSPWDAVADLRNNKKMAVFGTYAGFGTEGITDQARNDNPMLQDTGLRWMDQSGVEREVTANDLFRAVHDAFGHSMEGSGFRARGEENAWQAHVRLFYGPAIGAMTSETRGQNSWVNYGPYAEKNATAKTEETVFAEQKTGLMPEWTWTEGRAGDMPTSLFGGAQETRMSRVRSADEFLRQAVGDAEENLRKKMAKRKGTGVAKNNIFKMETADGKPIYVGSLKSSGGKPFTAWLDETEAWLSPEEIQAFRTWYKELNNVFVDLYQDRADIMMMAWLAAQQNVSPAGALKNVMRVMDRIAGMDSGRRGGLADEKIEGILLDAIPEKGFGPKLSDFVDAGFGRMTRTYVGGDPRGGQPFVADVHTGRDSGHVDHQTLSRIEEMARQNNLFFNGKPAKVSVLKTKQVKQGDKVKTVPVQIEVKWKTGKRVLSTDMDGSPGDTVYEGISEWGQELTSFLNEVGFGGGNWNASEVQAVGWMRVLRQYGLPEATVREAINANVGRVAAEVNFDWAQGRLRDSFPSLSSLPVDSARQITYQTIERSAYELADMLGGSAQVLGVGIGSGYWEGTPNPSVVIEVLGSPEIQANFADALAFASEQGSSFRIKFGVGGKGSRAIVAEKSDGSPITNEEIASLNEKIESSDKKIREAIPGYSIHTYKDGSRLIIAGLTPSKVSRAMPLLREWAEQSAPDITVDDVSAETEGTSNDWSVDRDGQTYLQEIVGRGGSEKIRGVVDFRRRYAEILSEEFAKQGVEVPADAVERSSVDPSVADQALGPTPDTTRLSRAGSAPIFYSEVERTVESARQPSAPAAQWMAWLSKQPGVKKEELEWMGVEEWLRSIDRPVKRQELLDFIKANKVEVRENIKESTVSRDSLRRYTEDLSDDALVEYAATETDTDAEEIRGMDREQIIDLLLENVDPYAEYDTDETKYRQYALDGGRNYRELLLTLPVPETEAPQELRRSYQWIDDETGEVIAQGDEVAAERWRQEDPDADIRFVTTETQASRLRESDAYRHLHWRDLNVLAFVRFDERIDDDGKRSVFLQEVQSDWHQEGRKKGYRPAGLPKNLLDLRARRDELQAETIRLVESEQEVPDSMRSEYASVVSQIESSERQLSEKPPEAPFKTSWPILAVKRMIRWAAENGFDRIAWTTGEMQAERYDLRKQIESVAAAPYGKDMVYLTIRDLNKNVVLEDTYPISKLPDVVGKDLAEKIASDMKDRPEAQDQSGLKNWKMYTGLDLKVGGEGMRGFYDKILPAEIGKYVKKWGGKVGMSDIDTGSRGGNWAVVDATDEGGREVYQRYPTEDAAKAALEEFEGGVEVAFVPGGVVKVHSMDVTPQMRESAMAGQPMFSRRRDRGADFRVAEATLGAEIYGRKVGRAEGMKTGLKVGAEEAKKRADEKLARQVKEYREEMKKKTQEARLGGEIYGKKKGRAEGKREGVREGMAEGVKKGRETAEQKAADKISSIIERQRNEALIRAQVADALKDIPQPNRGKFIAAVRDAKTPKNLARALSRINAELQGIEKKAMISEIKKLASRFQTSPAVAVDYRIRISELMNDILTSKPTAETIKKARSLQSYIDRQMLTGNPIDVPARTMKRLRVLSGRPLQDMSIGDLESLKGELERLILLGKSKLQRRVNLEQIQKDKDAADITSTSQGIDSRKMKFAPPDMPQKFGDSVSNSVNRALDRNRMLRINTLPVDVVIDMMDEGTATYDGPIYNTFKRPVDDAYSAWTLRFDAVQKDILDKKRELGIDGMASRRIGVFAADQQASGREKLRNLYRSQDEQMTDDQIDAEIDAVIGRMRPEDYEFYQYLRERLDAVRPELRTLMRDLFNEDLAVVENYFPFRTDYEAMQSDIIGERISDSIGWKKLPETGMLQKRRGAGRQAIRVDAIQIYLDHMKDVTYLLEMGPHTKYMRELLERDDVKVQVGDVGYTFLRDWIDTISRMGGVDSSMRIPWLDRMRQNVGVGILGLKVTTAMINITPVINAIPLVGPGTMHNLGTLLVDREWRQFLVNNLPEIANRVGNDPQFIELYDNSSWDSIRKKIATVGFYPIQRMDLWAAASVGITAYKKYLRDNNIPLDLSNPNLDAVRYAELMVRRTQSSGAFKDVPLAISRGRGITGNKSLNSALLQFTNFTLNQWSLLTYEGMTANDSPKDALRAFGIWTFAGMSMYIGQLMRMGYYDLISDLFGGGGDDERAISDRLMTEGLQAIPYFSPFMSSVIYGGQMVPVFDTLVSTAGGALQTVRGIMAADDDRTLRGLLALGTGAGKLAGIPGMTEVEKFGREALVPESKRVIGNSVRSLLDMEKDYGVRLPPARVSAAARLAFREALSDGVIETLDENGLPIPMKLLEQRFVQSVSARYRSKSKYE
jgi:hypothetical protein